jgi:TonB family protein
MVEERGEPFLPSSLATVRTRSSPGDTLARLGVRRVLACPVFSSAPSLRSTNSGAGRPSPFGSALGSRATKRYPESARQRGEEGSAALRFRIDRAGRVLDCSYRSTGYADLDAGLDEMMRGAQLPPFPQGMTAFRIEVSLTMQFNCNGSVRSACR